MDLSALMIGLRLFIYVISQGFFKGSLNAFDLGLSMLNIKARGNQCLNPDYSMD